MNGIWSAPRLRQRHRAAKPIVARHRASEPLACVVCFVCVFCETCCSPLHHFIQISTVYAAVGVCAVGVLRVDLSVDRASSLSSGCTPKVHTARCTSRRWGTRGARAVSVARSPRLCPQSCAVCVRGQHMGPLRTESATDDCIYLLYTRCAHLYLLSQCCLRVSSGTWYTAL